MQTIDHQRCPRAGGPSGATLVKTVRGILPVLLVWCAGAQAQPAPPDSVWSDEECWTLATVDATDGQGARICLCWTTVEEADAYRIWREIMVTQGLDEDGNLVELAETSLGGVGKGGSTGGPGADPVRRDRQPRWRCRLVGRIQRSGRGRLGDDGGR